MPTTSSGGTKAADSRLVPTSRLRRALIRPELGAMAGTIMVFVFFAILAGDSGMWTARGVTSLLEISAQIGLLAAPMALLIIAGEFDLSIGSMIGAAGMVFAIGSVSLGIPVWLMIILTLIFALAVGWVNGILVVRFGVSSFIVTLATLFILRGFSIGITRLLTDRTQVAGMDAVAQGDWLARIFSGDGFAPIYRWAADLGWIKLMRSGAPEVAGLPVTVLWWIAVTALASWILTRTQFGNWIFATGGATEAARNVGVPTDRVKIVLFMATSLCAGILAVVQVLDIGSADTLRGVLKEFEAIIAVVVGGTILAGGYGSVIGAMLGALIFGTVQIGLFYTHIDTDWFKAVVGVMLLLAVLLNNFVRDQLLKSRG